MVARARLGADRQLSRGRRHSQLPYAAPANAAAQLVVGMQHARLPRRQRQVVTFLRDFAVIAGMLALMLMVDPSVARRQHN
jgi:hypothetical protein